MNTDQISVILKRFETPDETRVLQKGRFELVRLGGMTIGRATCEPGWRWSEHVGPGVGATRCSVEHVGMVLSGAATAAFDDGRVFELRAGEPTSRWRRTTVGSLATSPTSRCTFSAPTITPSNGGLAVRANATERSTSAAGGFAEVGPGTAFVGRQAADLPGRPSILSGSRIRDRQALRQLIALHPGTARAPLHRLQQAIPPGAGGGD